MGNSCCVSDGPGTRSRAPSGGERDEVDKVTHRADDEHGVDHAAEEEGEVARETDVELEDGGDVVADHQQGCRVVTRYRYSHDEVDAAHLVHQLTVSGPHDRLT